MSSLDDFRHYIDLRVRWAEVDMQGVVFNGHYLTYCDVCLTEYWRAIGLRYPGDVTTLGVDFFARKTTVEYHAAARYDDELRVFGRTAQIGRSSLRFAVSMVRKPEPAVRLVDAELVYVNANVGSGKPQPWPALVLELIRGYERLPAVEAQRG